MGMYQEWTAELCRVRIDEELTIYQAAVLKAELCDISSKAAELEIDLAGVSEIDSAGFQLLVLLKREAAAANKRLSFCRHSSAVLKLLDLYQMAGAFGDPIVVPADAGH